MVTKRRVSQDEVSDNGKSDAPRVPEPIAGDAHESWHPADTSFEPSRFEAPPAPPTRPLIPGIDLDACALEEDYEEEQVGSTSLVVVVRRASGQGYFRTHPTLFRHIRMLEIKNGPDRGFY